jgi:hypothetical protein
MSDFTESVQNRSNADLLKMIYEIDQWSPEMLTAIETELSKRNILPAYIGERREKIVSAEDLKLSKGRPASLGGQVIGWLTIFGLLGIMIGYDYAFSKVISKYSDKMYFKYNEVSRKNGKYLFYTSIIASATAIFYKIAVSYGPNI